MTEEARLEKVGTGLAPVTEGWFVLNVANAAWLANAVFGTKCVFEADRPVLRQRPDLPVQRFEQVGVNLHVLEPGQPSGMYHAESNQEDFLVLAGECLVIVDGVERSLAAWDFVHCPQGTEHVFVGAGDSQCVILMTGRRNPDRQIVYPRSESARRYRASVETETNSAAEAYAPFPHWQPAAGPELGQLR